MKYIRCILVLCLALCLMTGCVAETAALKINKDGSGTITVQIGYTEEFIKQLNSIASQSSGESTIDVDQLEKITVDGSTYYGATLTDSFANAAELNLKFKRNLENGAATSEISAALSLGDFTLTPKGEGFILTLITPERPSDDSLEEMPTEEELKQYGLPPISFDDVIWRMTIDFPYPVIQTRGSAEGITISGGRVLLNFVTISKHSAQYLQFESIKDATSSVSDITFPDVKKGAWYYESVQLLAAGGLINGFENGTFRPYDTITVAQFCNILCKATGLQTGSDINGYWAGVAIMNCRTYEYIPSYGDITSANYDKPISRQVAISALQKATNAAKKGDKIWTAKDIPDYSSIDDPYKESILSAYNSGITTGSDEKHTFYPNRTLTRAEVCQMFSNAGATAVKVIK